MKLQLMNFLFVYLYIVYDVRIINTFLFVSDSVGIDTVVDTFSLVSNHLSPLWGSTVKLKKCFRNINTIQCVFAARYCKGEDHNLSEKPFFTIIYPSFFRSTLQFHIFTQLFQTWLEREGRQERNQGLTGLCVRAIASPSDDKNVLKTIHNEVDIITDLVDLKHKSLVQPEKDSSWINEFIVCLRSTDDVFMNHLSAL